MLNIWWLCIPGRDQLYLYTSPRVWRPWGVTWPCGWYPLWRLRLMGYRSLWEGICPVSCYRPWESTDLMKCLSRTDRNVGGVYKNWGGAFNLISFIWTNPSVTTSWKCKQQPHTQNLHAVNRNINLKVQKFKAKYLNKISKSWFKLWTKIQIKRDQPNKISQLKKHNIYLI